MIITLDNDDCTDTDDCDDRDDDDRDNDRYSDKVTSNKSSTLQIKFPPIENKVNLISEYQTENQTDSRPDSAVLKIASRSSSSLFSTKSGKMQS